ncbi:MAG TPA: PEGA domain-containing protein [Kofleriaceae bacterium]|nr:PEGA domain-containing protein [Kofleriaceae bacterium]
MRVWLASAVAVCAALGSARAQQRPDDSKPVPDDFTPGKRIDVRGEDRGFIGGTQVLEIDRCPEHDEMTPDQLRGAAAEHFDRGEVLYVQGDYHGAVTELVSAYCFAPYYAVLKDIGQAYERELEYEKAIAYFEKYVLAVPPDAKRTGQCGNDPQIEKENVSARIKVLRNLRAKVRVNTDPPGSKITLLDYQGTVAARGSSGDELAVVGGHYTVVVNQEGFEEVSTDVDVEIGKPYTIFSKLEALKGRLRVRVVPADSRLFLQYPNGDKLQVGNVGTGAFESALPGGKYRVFAEANGRVTVARDIEVLADKDTPISMDLPPVPQFGRRQLIVYSTVAGSVAGATLAGATENAGLVLTGFGAGLAGGFFIGYYATPSDIPLGTSSLTITSSLIGAVVAVDTASLFTEQTNVRVPMVGAGLIVGAGIGAYAGSRTHITPGDAAVINSGAVWGTATGTLFAGSFEADQKVSAGLVLSGLGMGTLGGVLVTRYFHVSRGRAALIDVGGVIGALVGFGTQNILSDQTNAAGTSTASETNYTLGGMITGLLVAGVLTRNMDAPKLAVTPTVSKTQGGTTTFGVGGDW